MKSRFPLPTRVLSNGEFRPLAQTRRQKLTEKKMEALAVRFGRKLGWSRRRFLRSTCGMAAAFVAMNAVYGRIFDVLPAEAADPEAADAVRNSLDKQFIFDVQLHFVREQYAWQGLGGLRRYARSWNRDLFNDKDTLEQLKFGISWTRSSCRVRQKSGCSPAPRRTTRKNGF